MMVSHVFNRNIPSCEVLAGSKILISLNLQKQWEAQGRCKLTNK